MVVVSDFRITYPGFGAAIIALNDRAKAWLHENADGLPITDGMMVEMGYLPILVEAAVADGFAVGEIEGDEGQDDEPWQAIRERGRLVGRQEWDSGGPGAGAGTVDVYLYRGAFYADDDVDAHGPFETFPEAANAVSLFHINAATTSIWVDPEFSDRDVAALNEQAPELHRQHDEEWRRRLG